MATGALAEDPPDEAGGRLLEMHPLPAHAAPDRPLVEENFRTGRRRGRCNPALPGVRGRRQRTRTHLGRNSHDTGIGAFHPRLEHRHHERRHARRTYQHTDDDLQHVTVQPHLHASRKRWHEPGPMVDVDPRVPRHGSVAKRIPSHGTRRTVLPGEAMAVLRLRKGAGRSPWGAKVDRLRRSQHGQRILRTLRGGPAGTTVSNSTPGPSGAHGRN